MTITPLPSSRRLAKNVIWGLGGQLAPMVVAIFSMPFLIRGLGVERFGVLALAWMVVGYFSVFDLGLGRALTKLVAEKLASGEEEEIPGLVWTALFLMLMLGCLGAVVVGLLTPWLVLDALNISADIQPEALRSFYVLTFFIPVLIIIAGLRGILEAYQRFGMIAGVSIPSGVYTYLGPLAVLPFTSQLPPIVIMLVAGRALSALAYLALCLRVNPALRRKVSLRPEKLRALVVFGGWLTVSNIVAPFMVYLDRFFIGTLLSVAAVAYYVTPFDVVTRLWVLFGAFTSVLFPAFSMAYKIDRAHLARIFSQAMKYAFMIVFPLTLCIVAFAHEGLDIWLGGEFAARGERVLQWLAVGVFFGCLQGVSNTLLQSAGWPDVHAKLHLLELPLYLLALWWAVSAFGVTGAAVVWAFRILLDGLAVSWVVAARIPEIASAVWKKYAAMGVALMIFGVAALLQGWVVKVIFSGLCLALCATVAWRYFMSPGERNMVRERCGGLRAVFFPKDAC